MVLAAKISGHIREGGLCGEWPLREGPLYSQCMLGTPMTYIYKELFVRGASGYYNHLIMRRCLVSCMLPPPPTPLYLEYVSQVDPPPPIHPSRSHVEGFQQHHFYGIGLKCTIHASVWPWQMSNGSIRISSWPSWWMSPGGCDFSADIQRIMSETIILSFLEASVTEYMQLIRIMWCYRLYSDIDTMSPGRLTYRYYIWYMWHTMWFH